ncbi:6,7-dimethyl-8-ribityllumazine synthase [Candidatus Liberibacter brunswickensis]|uniref:6,7-dimethyl-8-ribityllumazine synthase n=1 Tax=Candidatus Liberibacter brunswickensis TaxID=1968796 RepID=UPI002FE25187
MVVLKPRVLIVEARFYENLSEMLLEGCVNVFKNNNIEWDSIVTPGVLEIPSAISMVMSNVTLGKKYHGIVVLGVVIRGKTSHCDIIANAVTNGLVDLSIKDSLPIGNGIVTVDNKEQAIERVHSVRIDRGGAAARSVIAMIELKNSLSKQIL